VPVDAVILRRRVNDSLRSTLKLGAVGVVAELGEDCLHLGCILELSESGRGGVAHGALPVPKRLDQAFNVALLFQLLDNPAVRTPT